MTKDNLHSTSEAFNKNMVLYTATTDCNNGSLNVSLAQCFYLSEKMTLKNVNHTFLNMYSLYLHIYLVTFKQLMKRVRQVNQPQNMRKEAHLEYVVTF